MQQFLYFLALSVCIHMASLLVFTAQKTDRSVPFFDIFRKMRCWPFLSEQYSCQQNLSLRVEISSTINFSQLNNFSKPTLIVDIYAKINSSRQFNFLSLEQQAIRRRKFFLHSIKTKTSQRAHYSTQFCTKESSLQAHYTKQNSTSLFEHLSSSNSPGRPSNFSILQISEDLTFKTMLYYVLLITFSRISISRLGQHLDQYLCLPMKWAYTTTVLSVRFIYYILASLFLLYLYVRNAAWLTRTFKTLSFVLFGTFSQIGSSRLDQMPHSLRLHMNCAYKTPVFSSRFVYSILSALLLLYLYVRSVVWLSRTSKTLYFVLLGTFTRIGISRLGQHLDQYLCLPMKWAYKTTDLFPDSFTAFSLRYYFSISIFWRRHKIGVDAACFYGHSDIHTCSEFTVVVRFLFILVVRKCNTARHLHPVTTGILSDYDKRVAYS